MSRIVKNSKLSSNLIIPILAIALIFLTISILGSPKGEKKQNFSAYIPVPETEIATSSAVKLAFVPAGVSLRQDESANVDLWLTPKRKINLDGINLSLNFNPDFLQVTQVMTPKLFSLVTENRIEENGKINLIFLEEKTGGLLLGQPVKLLTLTIKGKAMGEGEIAFIKEEGKTVITETNKSQPVSFDSGNLKLVVY